ncbi:hypothetical protein O3M35_003348 [Rhynocoris fuscipes]|uniref:Uncharacterized protein n=1 Tax=Rhynocoris fuscipes TaxID=488301 RepID=A0AAW1CJU4_9HEMI
MERWNCGQSCGSTKAQFIKFKTGRFITCDNEESSTSTNKGANDLSNIGRLSENVVLVWLSWESDCSARSRQHLIYFY